VVWKLTVPAVGNRESSVAVWAQNGRVVVEGCDPSSAIGSVVPIAWKDSASVIWDCQIRDGKSVGILAFNHRQVTIEQRVLSVNNSVDVLISQG